MAFSRGVSRLGAEYTLIPIAGGLYLSGVLTRQPKLRDTGLLGAEALVDGLIVSEVLKAATGRQRPLEGDAGGHFFHGSDGFPSGHTIGGFALASVIAHQYHDNKAVVILASGYPLDSARRLQQSCVGRAPPPARRPLPPHPAAGRGRPARSRGTAPQAPHFPVSR